MNLIGAMVPPSTNFLEELGIFPWRNVADVYNVGTGVIWVQKSVNFFAFKWFAVVSEAVKPLFPQGAVSTIGPPIDAISDGEVMKDPVSNISRGCCRFCVSTGILFGSMESDQQFPWPSISNKTSWCYGTIICLLSFWQCDLPMPNVLRNRRWKHIQRSGG